MKQIFDLLKKTTPVFVEIRGRKTVLAEGYCRIESYSDETVILASAEGSISVRGENLYLKHLSSERIAVEGRINGIEFL